MQLYLIPDRSLDKFIWPIICPNVYSQHSAINEYCTYKYPPPRTHTHGITCTANLDESEPIHITQVMQQSLTDCVCTLLNFTTGAMYVPLLWSESANKLFQIMTDKHVYQMRSSTNSFLPTYVLIEI